MTRLACPPIQQPLSHLAFFGHPFSVFPQSPLRVARAFTFFGDVSMTALDDTTLESLDVGASPLVRHFLQRLQLQTLFARFLPSSSTGCPEKLSCAVTLTALITHLLLARRPLYALADWFSRSVPDHFELQSADVPLLHDDRVGRALERLCDADCASLLTCLVLHAVREFHIDLEQLHNDSTTVTFSGAFNNQTTATKLCDAGAGAEESTEPGRQADASCGVPLITFGYNKDHRPDLKQLLYCVTVSADGAVPVHFKVYDGNTTDDTTHLETWSFLCKIVGHVNFLYVADSKLCSHPNLDFIAGKQGRFLTVMPRTWKEAEWMQQYVQDHENVAWQQVRRDKRRKANLPDAVYDGFEYPRRSSAGYRILWYRSSVKQEEDAGARQRCLESYRSWHEAWKATPRLGSNRFTSEAKALSKGENLLREKRMTAWAQYRVEKHTRSSKNQVGGGRPGPHTTYEIVEETWYELILTENQQAIEAAAKRDGLFPLITNDEKVSLKEALGKYKYQPFLEKRFEQMKTVFEVMPMWLKSPERIAGLMFAYYVVLLVEALIEREVRQQMGEKKIKGLALYPERRMSKAPTAELVMGAFEGLRRHRLCNKQGQVLKTFHDALPDVAREVLLLLGIDPAPYGPA